MVNIKEVAEYVAANNNICTAASANIVRDVFDYIKGELTAGNDVNIDKFGKFATEDKPERECRNPKTGEKMIAPAKTVVKFKPAKNLKDEVKDA